MKCSFSLKYSPLPFKTFIPVSVPLVEIPVKCLFFIRCKAASLNFLECPQHPQTSWDEFSV